MTARAYVSLVLSAAKAKSGYVLLVCPDCSYVIAHRATHDAWHKVNDK